MQIADRTVGRQVPPFIIAEMSGNHNQSLERALELVELAARAGAHALKLQTYTPDTMTLDLDEREFHISDPESPWAGRSLYDLYGEAYTPWDWHEPIFARAAELGILAFSTPFDHTAVDFLEELDVPCYKVASFENTDVALLRRVAETGKPMIVSTGMATAEELEETVEVVRSAGCQDLVFLKCTSTYPASPDDSNLLTIPMMRATFGCEVGLSDHTLGIGAAVASVALGATVIEKHFTTARADRGVDSAFSLEPAELAQLVEETDRAWRALGTARIGPTSSEGRSLQFRRSLYVVRDLRLGDVLTPQSVRAIRPGFGLPTKHLDEVLGRSVTRDVPRGTALTWELLD